MEREPQGDRGASPEYCRGEQPLRRGVRQVLYWFISCAGPAELLWVAVRKSTFRKSTSPRSRVDGVEYISSTRIEQPRDGVEYAIDVVTSAISVDVHAGGYTGVTYNPTRRQILVGPGRGVKDHFVQQLDAAARGIKRFQNQPFQFKRIRDLYPHFEYSDLAAHPCIV